MVAVTIVDHGGDPAAPLQPFHKQSRASAPSSKATTTWHGENGKPDDDMGMIAPPPVPSPQRLPLTWARDIEPVLQAQGTLVEDLLDIAAMSVIYGPSNTGKTFFALDLAAHVAMGRPWFGHAITTPGCVVYVAAEGGHGIRNRVAAIKKYYGVSNMPLAVITSPIDLLNPAADLPHLLERTADAALATGLPCVLVIVDTLSRAMAGGDENGPKDMTGFVSNIDRLRAAGPHVLVIHHTGKDDGKGARGHSSLRAATDTEMELKIENEAEKRATAYVRKQRDMQGGDRFVFRLKSVPLGETQNGKSLTSCVIEPDERAVSESAACVKLTPNEQKGFDDLIAMFGDQKLAVERIPRHGMSSTLTLTREQVRRGYVERGTIDANPDGTLTGAIRTKLSNMLKGLKTKGKIEYTDQYFWLL